jgi:hypothetical protein
MFLTDYMAELCRAGWALSVAMSRAFGFKRLGGWALVPLVDMANHALVSNAEIRFGEDGVVRMMANKQVRGCHIHVRESKALATQHRPLCLTATLWFLL